MEQSPSAHIAAYRKWRTAANAPDHARQTTPEREARKQARIVKLRDNYERLLREAKAAGIA